MPTISQKSIPTPKVSPRFISGVAQDQAQPQKLRTRQKLKQEQRFRQAQKQILSLQQTQTQRQRLGLRFAPLLKQKTTQRGLAIPRFSSFSKGKIKPLVPFPRIRRKPTEEKPLRRFTTFIRRRGEFFPIGQFQTQKKAFAVGRERISTTLGATFFVQGKTPTKPKTPFGFYQKPTKKGILFIENPRLRLSTLGERKEIQVAKRRKRK